MDSKMDRETPSHSSQDTEQGKTKEMSLEDIRPDLFDNRPSTYLEEGHNKQRED